MTNDPNCLDRIEALLEETIRVIRSNGKAIQANSAAIAANNQKFEGVSTGCNRV